MTHLNDNETPSTVPSPDGVWVVLTTNVDYEYSDTKVHSFFEIEKDAVDYVTAHNEKGQEIVENEYGSSGEVIYSVEFAPKAKVVPLNVQCVYEVTTFRNATTGKRVISAVKVTSWEETEAREDQLEGNILAKAFDNPTLAFQQRYRLDEDEMQYVETEILESSVFPELSETYNGWEEGQEHFVRLSKDAVILASGEHVHALDVSVENNVPTVSSLIKDRNPKAALALSLKELREQLKQHDV